MADIPVYIRDDSVTLTKSPGYYAFAGNPVVFEFETDIQGEVTVGLTIGDNTRYLSFYPIAGKVRFDIAGMLKPYFKKAVYPEGEIIGIMEDFAVSYDLTLDEETIFTGTAFAGGVSKYALGIMSDEDFDMFSYRLNDEESQFLFTTRTNDDELRIRVTELYPFVFIHPGTAMQFVSGGGNTVSLAAMPAGTICSMDIQALINRFAAQYGEIPASIDVCPAGNPWFTVTLLPGKESEEKYKIRFKNSLGAFEVIEVTGTAKHEPEMGEENLYNKFTAAGYYEERRMRVMLRDILKVEAGYRNSDDLQFILDMVRSEEIYFIFPDESYFRCNVTADSPQYNHRITTPTSMLLNIRMVTDEQFHTPKLIPDIVHVLANESGGVIITEESDNNLILTE